MRDRAYRKQNEGFASRAGKPFASLTLLLAAISWIVIYSSILLIWDYNDNVKDSYMKQRTRHRDEYLSFESYLRRREEGRRMRRYQFNEYKPSEEARTQHVVPPSNSPDNVTNNEAVDSHEKEPIVSSIQ